MKTLKPVQPRTEVQLHFKTLLPELLQNCGPEAAEEFLSFFAGMIRNANTREAYARAWTQFDRWCKAASISCITDVRALHVAAYIEQLGTRVAPTTVKQHRAALSKVFDFLVVRQIVPANPAANVAGPRVPMTKGKTATLTDEEFLDLIESIPTDSLIGLRDRAFICLLTYTWPRVTSAVNLTIRDYYPKGKRWYIDLQEKGGKETTKLAHHRTQDALDAYLAKLGGEPTDPIFQSFDQRRKPTGKALLRRNALDMVKRRARSAGLNSERVCNHSFRATGITNYMSNGGRIDVAQEWASHSDPRTTSIYDHSQDKVSTEEVERIRFERD